MIRNDDNIAELLLELHTPAGTKFWHDGYGEYVTFVAVEPNKAGPILCRYEGNPHCKNAYIRFSIFGAVWDEYGCHRKQVLWPAANCRDWNNFGINLCEMLKDVPIGTELYSDIHGVVEFKGINDKFNSIELSACKGYVGTSFPFDGVYDGENDEYGCRLFPSKLQRNWRAWYAEQHETKNNN